MAEPRTLRLELVSRKSAPRLRVRSSAEILLPADDHAKLISSSTIEVVEQEHSAP